MRSYWSGEGRTKAVPELLGLTMLTLAQTRNPKAVENLIEVGAHLDTADRLGQTALHLAAKNGDTHTVDLLLRCGALVDARTDQGDTSLHFAAKNGSGSVVNRLLTANADVAVTNLNSNAAAFCCPRKARA